MRIDNATPHPAALLPWVDVEGRPQLTVLVKTTFAMEAGSGPKVASEQLPILAADELTGDDSSSSVRLESDLVPFKPRADIVLSGKAHAPGGKTVTHLDVSLRVGRLQKKLRAIGDRRWWFPSRLVLVSRVSAPRAFRTMDLVYERAYGGIDTAGARWCRENLVGRGFIGRKRPKSIHGKPLPNIEDPAKPIRSWRTRPKPAGFGFYGRGWMPRLAYAGTYDEKHQKERAPEPPKDFSLEYFNGAHPDLQVKGWLRGDEEVELVNLSRAPVLRFRLPGLRPKIEVLTWDAAPEAWLAANAERDPPVTLEDVPATAHAVEPVLDTLVFLPEDGVFYEVFRAVFPLNSLEEPNVARVRIENGVI